MTKTYFKLSFSLCRTCEFRVTCLNNMYACIKKFVKFDEAFTSSLSDETLYYKEP